jgi:aspartate/methionine/tyrosine aminotransferase
MPDSSLPDVFTAPRMPLRESAAKLEVSQIVELWELRHGHDDLIPLWVGEGDLPTPKFISDAAHRALLDGHTFYGPKRGVMDLRRALTTYHRRHWGVALEVERVSVTPSAMNAIMLTLQAILDQGDNLVVVTPAWPNIFSAVQIMGGETRPVELAARAGGSFKLDLDRLFDACDARTRGIFVISPANPTGWVIDPDEQRAILEFCRRRGIWLIADEVYHRFIYDRPVAPSFLEIAEAEDPLFVVNSFSKTWAMTGWRVGWLVHPPSMGPMFDKLVEYNSSGGQPFLQQACVAALEQGEAFVAENVARCRRGGELIHQRLSALPRVRISRPRATFYSFIGIEGLTDEIGFCKRVLAETSVGLAPGTAFGPGGEGHLRLCFAAAPERLSEAMDRLEPLFR